jgi:gliding motility-associated-like protein
MDKARAYCDGSKIILTLNKKMRCSTLAANGSDFRLATPLATVTGAAATACSSAFDTDSLEIMLSNPLPPGTYSLIIQKGADGNTILDYCDRGIPEEDKVDFTVVPVAPTPMDSISAVGCAPSVLELVFQKPMRCSSISADGSDFVVNGNPGIAVSAAQGNCSSDDLSSVIYVTLNQPVVQKGSYTITLQRGNDGNTIIDECGEETPAGSQLGFATADTVSAAFDYDILWGCSFDTVRYTHPGGNDIYQWTWIFDDNSSANTRYTEKTYSIFGQKSASLIVSNGVCADTSSAVILLDNTLKADFDAPEFVCPNDTVLYKDASIGKIASWVWDFGNGARSLSPIPAPQQYPAPLTDREYTIRLEITDSIGCSSQSVHTIKAVSSCYIAIPSAFTPNADNLNDYLYPLNAYKAEDLVFRVYNLYGQKVFETRDRFTRWNGTFNGKMQQPGTFVWTLHYIHKDTRRIFDMKGTTTLIR